MFSHVFVSVSEFEKAFAFYQSLMLALDNELRFCDATKPWAGWNAKGRSRPLFVICKPYNGQDQDSGNGQMIAFQARTRAVVQGCYALALANGGSCEGVPGLRTHYHENYYGAYFRDLDGNKLCVACHEAEPKE
jgi:catechol 2,3-dioxygenase-like lactoylglutathione lyase family enzyme